MEGVDADDFSGLYDALDAIGQNYTSTAQSYFNYQGAYDYFRHYQKNYVPNKVGLFTQDARYYYPTDDAFLPVFNYGEVNHNENLYSFGLEGEDVTARLSSTLIEDDLTLIKNDTTYQAENFTLDDLDETYCTTHSFTRISENKYQTTDSSCWPDFINLCAYSLINTGHYMTFSRMTVETAPMEGCALRIRLYASKTQTGKLREESLDKVNKPNWYLLFAEATISDVGTTAFTPIEGL